MVSKFSLARTSNTANTFQQTYTHSYAHRSINIDRVYHAKINPNFFLNRKETIGLGRDLAENNEVNLVAISDQQRVIYTSDPELLSYISPSYSDQHSFMQALSERTQRFGQSHEERKKYAKDENYFEFLHALTNYDLGEEMKNSPDSVLHTKKEAFEVAGSLVGGALSLNAEYFALSRDHNLHPRAKPSATRVQHDEIITEPVEEVSDYQYIPELFIEVISFNSDEKPNFTIIVTKERGEDLRLSVFPINAGAIAIPHENLYTLVAAEDSSNQELVKIMAYPSLMGEDLKMASNLIMSNRFSSEYVTASKELFPEEKITRVINVPSQKLFRCHTQEGVAFSLAHDLYEMDMHLLAISRDYMGRQDIAYERDLVREFTFLCMQYGEPISKYFRLKYGVVAAESNNNHPYVYINKGTQKLLFVPPIDSSGIPLSETEEETFLSAVVQDVNQKKLHTIAMPHLRSSSIFDTLPYSYLEPSEGDVIFLGLANNGERQEKVTLPNFAAKEIVMLPVSSRNLYSTQASETEKPNKLKLDAFMQNQLHQITLTKLLNSEYQIQSIDLYNRCEGSQDAIKCVIQKYSEDEKDFILILPTVNEIDGKRIVSKPLFVRLENAITKDDKLEPCFENTVLFNSGISIYLRC